MKARNEFKKVANFASQPEAEMMAELLKKNGIPVQIRSVASGIPSIVMTAPGGYSLFVPEGEIEKALKILPKR